MSPAQCFLSLLMLTLALPSWCGGQVALTGVMGSKALLVVDGGAPRMVEAGDTYAGITVLAVSRVSTTAMINGERVVLRVGGIPTSVGASNRVGERKLVLQAKEGGHYMAPGKVNGRGTQFLVDTGASLIGMGAAEAERLGLHYQDGEPINIDTSNGSTRGWLVKLDSVRMGDIEVRDLEAAVTPQAMPYILLGNNFLDRVNMRRENQLMTLEQSR